MSTSEGSPRPRQLTMAGVFVVIGSVLLLVTAFDSLSNLRSVRTRNTVTEVLDTPTGAGLGISVEQALEVMRIGLGIAAVAAAVAAVLGVFVLQRHRGARIALSIVAVPILLTAPFTGGLSAAVVAAGTAMLWTGPARDWFAGRPVRELPSAADRRRDRSGSSGSSDRPDPFATPPSVPPTGSPTGSPAGTRVEGAPSASELSTSRPSEAPSASSGYGERPVQGTAAPTSGASPGSTAPGWPPPGPTAHETAPATGQPVPQYAPVGWGQVPVGDAVPPMVKVACLLTWGFSGVVALTYAAMVLALAVAQDAIVDFVVSSPEWQRAGLSGDLLLPVLWTGSLMFLAWSGGALVLAWFTWRRHNWARYLLTVSAGTTIVVALFAFPFGLLHQAAAALTIAGLFGTRSRAWFARAGNGHPAPPGPPAGPPPGSAGPPPTGSGRPPVW